MMNLNPGSVDSALSVIEAYEKDPGFKDALKKLKDARAGMKTTEAETAGFEKRMKLASDEAEKQKLSALKAKTELSVKEQGLAERESELVLAKSAFEEESANTRNLQVAAATELTKERSNLHTRESDLKRREDDLLKKVSKLDTERREFDAWRDKVRSLVA